MELPTLRQQFGDTFSSSAFQTIDDERNIVGKFGRIAQFPDGSFDCWFVHPSSFPLSPRKLAAIRKKCLLEDGFTELDGEAYTQGAGRDFVLRMAVLAEVKRKRTVTAAVRHSLRKARAAKAGLRHE